MKTLLFVLLVFLVFSCSKSLPDGTYTVRKISNHATEIDGLIADGEWTDGNIVNNFIFPWNDEEVPFTQFKSFHDGFDFYFVFTVDDDDIQLEKEWTGERSIINEDRVEIFMSVDDSLKTYYGMEMDSEGRLLDYKGTYYRKSDWAWSVPGLVLAASNHKTGYTVEGKIPLEELRSLQIIKENGMAMIGLYRGEFSMENDTRITRWISWVDPKTPKPDFHVPSSFGKFYFEK